MKKKSKKASRYSPLVLLAAILWVWFQQYIAPETTMNPTPTAGESMMVHFIDVGQGDAILIQTENKAMLVDAGENNMGDTVVSYIKEQGIDSLDYVIGTHPHSDHIGGLDTVIKAFDIDTVILPDVMHTTKTFEDVLDAIDEKNLKITKPIVGTTYELGDARFTIIAPNSSKYHSLNDYSVGIKLTYGNRSFLMVADAEKLSEKEILQNGINLKSDVLKLSHHGSNTSSCDEFLDAVTPEHVVISVGADNDYGHPHKEVMNALKQRNLPIYRTDKQQTIVFTTDGDSIEVNNLPID